MDWLRQFCLPAMFPRFKSGSEHNKNWTGRALFSRIQQPRLTFWLAIAGALSFWLADLAIHVAASLDSTPARWDAAFVFLPPGTFLFTYLIARRVAARRGRVPLDKSEGSVKA
jgi:hypothetical protein